MQLGSISASADNFLQSLPEAPPSRKPTETSCLSLYSFPKYPPGNYFHYLVASLNTFKEFSIILSNFAKLSELKSSEGTCSEIMTEDVIYQKTLNEVQRHLVDIRNTTDKAKILYIMDITKKYISRFRRFSYFCII